MMTSLWLYSQLVIPIFIPNRTSRHWTACAPRHGWTVYGGQLHGIWSYCVRAH
uniref:Uncharacterized protein n=1 Tax=uncultured alpha proteobacterium EF100_102A06 TaxID=710799 RepID=E0Y273_9PROT|nr:hypothetical protein [uncultured alpha proteobacterium EF100_102A06]